MNSETPILQRNHRCKKKQAVAAVIEKNGLFLVGKRSPSKRSAPGYWCPVSGGIEFGETEEVAAIREAHEEVGLKIEPVRKICEFDSADGARRIHWWLMKIVDGDPYLKNDEHSELRWVTLDEFRLLQPIFPEDIEVFVKAQRILLTNS